MRRLTVRGWGTLGAVLILIGVVIAALLSLPRQAPPTAPTPSPVATTNELARCRELGAAAESDTACHAAWQALNDHFFGKDRKAARP
jgi:conjugative transfer region protein TrbK